MTPGYSFGCPSSSRIVATGTVEPGVGAMGTGAYGPSWGSENWLVMYFVLTPSRTARRCCSAVLPASLRSRVTTHFGTSVASTWLMPPRATISPRGEVVWMVRVVVVSSWLTALWTWITWIDQSRTSSTANSPATTTAVTESRIPTRGRPLWRAPVVRRSDSTAASGEPTFCAITRRRRSRPPSFDSPGRSRRPGNRLRRPTLRGFTPSRSRRSARRNRPGNARG